MATAQPIQSQPGPRDDVTHFCFPFSPPPANPFAADGSGIAFVRAGTPIFTHPLLPAASPEKCEAVDDCLLSTAALANRLSRQLNAASADVEQLRRRLAAQCEQVGVRGCCGRHCRHMWHGRTARGSQCTLRQTGVPAESDVREEYARSTDPTVSHGGARTTPSDAKHPVPEMTSSPCSSARSTPSALGRAPEEHSQERKTSEKIAGSRSVDAVAESVGSPLRSERDMGIIRMETAPEATGKSNHGSHMTFSPCTPARSTPQRESINIEESVRKTERHHTDPSEESETTSRVLSRKGATSAVQNPAQCCDAKERDPMAVDDQLTSTPHHGDPSRQSVASVDAASKMPVSARSSAFSTPVTQKKQPVLDSLQRPMSSPALSSSANVDLGRRAGTTMQGSMPSAKDDVAGGTGSTDCANNDADNDVMAKAFGRRRGDSLAIARTLFSEQKSGNKEQALTSAIPETAAVDKSVGELSLPNSNKSLPKVPGTRIAPAHVVRITAQRLRAAGKHYGTQKSGANLQSRISEETQDLDDGTATTDGGAEICRDDVGQPSVEECLLEQREKNMDPVSSRSESSTVQQTGESSNQVSRGPGEGQSDSPEIVFFDAPKTFTDGTLPAITLAQGKTDASDKTVGVRHMPKTTSCAKTATNTSTLSPRYDGDRPAFCMGSVPGKSYRRLPASAKWRAPSIGTKACPRLATPIVPPSDDPTALKDTAPDVTATWPVAYKVGAAEIQKLRTGAGDGGAVCKDAESECRGEPDDALKFEGLGTGATGRCVEEDDESRQLVISGHVRGALGSSIRETASVAARQDYRNQSMATQVNATRSRHTVEEITVRNGEDNTPVLEGREKYDVSQLHAAPIVDDEIPLQHVFLCILLGLLSLMSLLS